MNDCRNNIQNENVDVNNNIEHDNGLDNTIDHDINPYISHDQSENQNFVKDNIEFDAKNIDGLRRSTRVRKIPTFLMDYHYQVNTSPNTMPPQNCGKYPISFVLSYNSLSNTLLQDMDRRLLEGN